MDIVYIRIEDCELTTREFVAEAERLKVEHPDQEIFLDGDAHALVGRNRA